MYKNYLLLKITKKTFWWIFSKITMQILKKKKKKKKKKEKCCDICTDVNGLYYLSNDQTVYFFVYLYVYLFVIPPWTSPFLLSFHINLKTKVLA